MIASHLCLPGIDGFRLIGDIRETGRKAVQIKAHKDRGMAVKLLKDGCDILLPAALQD